MVKKNREITQLLPGVYQTETLTKFFSATANHLFQPEDVDFINGYVGNIPGYYNSAKDFYIGEPNKTRANYQLTPASISVDSTTGTVNTALFYDDLINQLSYQGANVENHSRLFQQEYYSWSPPIDIDKFINYGEYYWMLGGPGEITLLDNTNSAEIIGVSQYTYVGAYRQEFTGNIINGQLKFTSGLKIKFTSDANTLLNNITYIIENVGNAIMLVEPSTTFMGEWDASQNLPLLKDGIGKTGTEYQVTTSGVANFGTTLSPRYTNFTVGDLVFYDGAQWDKSPGVIDYVTIQRGSRDQNLWSATNNWYHRDVIFASGPSQLTANVISAQRPIIEFDRHIALYNYGVIGRGSVTSIVDTVPNVFSSIVGQSSYVYDGVNLDAGMRLLVISDQNPLANNRIYEVTFIGGLIELILINNGQNLDGSPCIGDGVYTSEGMYWYNGLIWTSTQQKIPNVPPLFRIYDVDGNTLDDPSIYPNSTFIGSTVFEYASSTTGTIDSVLGIIPKVDQFGDFVFNNTLEFNVYQYQKAGTLYTIYGYQFVSIADDYINGWYKAPTNSRQYIVNEYSVSGSASQFTLDWPPDQPINNQLPPVTVTLIRNQKSQLLVRDQDYIVQKNLVKFVTSAVDGDRIVIRSWSSFSPTQPITGYFELPLNLTANPNNQPIISVSRSDFLAHFIDIMSNQTGIIGEILGSNNWRDTAKEKSIGTKILQHRAPMLKLMVMNSQNLTTTATTSNATSLIDPVQSIRYNQREYLRFYNRFVKTLFNLYNNNGYNSSQDSQTWVINALKQVNLGKTTRSAYANSGYDLIKGSYCSLQTSSPTFIPPTPTRLGVGAAYQPYVAIDSSYAVPQLVLQTHDGSRIVLQDSAGETLGTIVDGELYTTTPGDLTHPVAAAWLQFELNIFNNLPSGYSDFDSILPIDERTIRPGKWRYSGYTRSEYLGIESPNFEKWITFNQIDYRANTGFDINDQFSFNYRSGTDFDGQPVPGYWRGMYAWFYDTDRPHTCPWEMLGFSQKPSWWNTEYGRKPYTRGNMKMWQDLTAGLIRHGSRAGIHAVWARPGLMRCIPVDDQGNLLPPNLAGCVKSLPSVVDASSNWYFGDGSPIEQVWRNSQEGHFSKAITAYLARPAQFIEYAWDSLRIKRTFPNSRYSQIYYVDTNRRRGSNEFYVHEENPLTIQGVNITNESSASYFGSCGIQHWTSEYLISQSLSVTNNFGNIIRGADVKLGHKCAGYIATDSLRVLADSFGQVGYQSQIVPSENIKTYLYRSTSTGEFFYSGIIVKQQSNGWAVIGYDGINPAFTIIPSEKNGLKNTVVIGNQTVIEYTQGKNTTKSIPYGTVFNTRQLVYDFIISYGRCLESQGWVFDISSSVSWSQMAKEFLFWSQGSWIDGSIVALSPLGDQAKFTQNFGTIQLVSGFVTSSYPVLDKIGLPIETQNLEILRDQNEIIVRPTNTQTIYGLRVFVTTLEHAILFDNITVFNDIIYQPIYNLAQQRLKLLTYRTNNWTGRLDAPGYFLSQNITDNTWNMVSNFEKTADDIRRYFNIDQPTSALAIQGSELTVAQGTTISQQTALAAVNNETMSSLSKHLVGYQKRDYLQNLLLEDSVEFEFYQGFIRQKGTKAVIDALLRNSYVVPGTETFEYYEEYALRISSYGATKLNNILEFIITQNDVTNNPQQIAVFYEGDNNKTTSDAIYLTANDPRIIIQPTMSGLRQFKTRENLSPLPTDLPNAGYVLPEEVNWTVFNNSELTALWNNKQETSRPVRFTDTVWQIVDNIGNWTVWQLAPATANVISTDATNTLGGNQLVTTINFDGNHGIQDYDQIIITGVANVEILNGTFTAVNVTATTVDIQLSTPVQGFGGAVAVYKPVRFTSIAERDALPPVGGWQYGQSAWIDSVGSTGWEVCEFTQRGWILKRQQTPKVDPTIFQQATLYRNDTFDRLTNLTYYDPAKCIIPGAANAEISYKTTYDPAKYNQGDATVYSLQTDAAWGIEKVGTVWWNLNTTRYIEYETGETSYREKHWGKLVAGSTIDIYEWIRSPIPPSEWTSYVVQFKNINQNGTNYVPTGNILNASPAYTETVEYDTTGTAHTWYYFWVGNSTLPPIGENRTMTTQAISELITDPTSQGLSWYAAIDSSTLIVANIRPLMSGNSTVMKLIWGQPVDGQVEFNQWILSQKDNPTDTIDPRFWQKMRDSLVGYDALGNQVPDINLNELSRYGMLIRPRQTWFKNRVAAINVWINQINKLIAVQPVPLSTNPDITGWLPYFTASEPEPINFKYMTELFLVDKGVGYHPRDIIRLNAEYNNNSSVQAIATVSTVMLSNIIIQNSGTGYSIGDVITFNGGYGVAAALSATNVDINGNLIAVSTTQAGAYTILPLSPVHSISNASGSGATFTYDTNIREVDLLNPGAFTNPNAVLENNASISSSNVISNTGASGATFAATYYVPNDNHIDIVDFIVVNPGIGYQIGDTVELLGGIGVPAQATVQNVNAAIGNGIISVSVLDSGAYTTIGIAPGFTSNVTGVGTGATLNPIYSNGGSHTQSVSNIIILNAGTGYNPGDVITLIGGEGTPCNLTVQSVDPYELGITGINITDAGNYSIVPIDPISGNVNVSITEASFNALYTDLWSIRVADITARDQLVKTGHVSIGQTVLVDPTPDFGNLWTLQYWDGINWTITRIQSYSVNRFWNYVDWYAVGYSADVSVNYLVNTISGLNTLPEIIGKVAKVLNNGTNLWQLYVYDGFIWKLIGQQSGSIKVSLPYQGWDTSGFDSTPFDASPDTELGYIFDGVYNHILATYGTGELNTLFYEMLNYVLVEQGFVDWIIKTSYIILRGFNQPFDQNQIYSADLIESLISYINEAKPYHTKIREFISGRTAIDQVSIHTTDFDNPSGIDVDWINAYQTHPQLIRNLKTQLVYDRVSSVFSSNVYIANSNVQSASARISSYYDPTQFQPPISPQLIDADFNGTVLDGIPFVDSPGWSVAPWGDLGWNPSNQSIDDYIDLSVQAGIPPVYNAFYGNNIKTTFVLNYIPQDVGNTIVWVNNTVVSYGIDWIIPNWVGSIQLNDAGTQYQIGDQLALVGGTYSRPTLIHITSVDGSGAITGYNLYDFGDYSIIPGSTAITTIVSPLTSTGHSATFDTIWMGKTLTFTNPPIVDPNGGPSVYVLLSGTTFEAAPDGPTDTIYDGHRFVQPGFSACHLVY